MDVDCSRAFSLSLRFYKYNKNIIWLTNFTCPSKNDIALFHILISNDNYAEWGILYTVSVLLCTPRHRMVQEKEKKANTVVTLTCLIL